MKLLVFADLHLDATFSWLGTKSQAGRKLRNSLRDTLKRILQLAVDEEVDAILCGGDLYEHEHFSPDTANFLQKSFSEVHPIPIFLAPGNHDWLGPGSIYTTASWSSNVNIFREMKFNPVELSEGLTIWGYAHHSPSESFSPFADFEVGRGGVNLALFHGAENGIFPQFNEQKGKYGAFDGADLQRAGLDYAFVGHYHKPFDEPLFAYPGNPHPLEFGEDGTRAPILVEIDQTGVRAKKRVPVSEPIFFDLHVDVSSAQSSQDIREQVRAELEERDGLARVWLTGELSPEVELQPEDLEGIEASVDHFVFRTDTLHVGYDISRISEEPTVRGVFCKNVLDSDLDEELKKRVLVTGLRALDGHRELDTIQGNDF